MTRTHKGVIYFDPLTRKYFQRRCSLKSHIDMHLVSKLCDTVEEALVTKDTDVTTAEHILKCSMVEHANIQKIRSKLNTTRIKHGKIQKNTKNDKSTEEKK